MGRPDPALNTAPPTIRTPPTISREPRYDVVHGHAGPQAGLVAVHKRAVATSHSLRRLTLPTAISTAETSNGQEDVLSFSWEAVGTLADAIRLTREVTACEPLAVHQAFALSKRPVPVGLRALLRAAADVVPPIEADRPYGEDLGRLIALLGACTAGESQRDTPGSGSRK